MKLGDMGAEVIKIEQPKTGDDTRGWGPPFVRGESAYFLSVNRNKKSLTLDLKSDEGKEILKKLVRRCDVLVENFRAGVLEKLGFGYETVKTLNPKIIYCSISGYGHSSSLSSRPSYDLIVQGESGLMDITGFPDGPPTKVGISLADVAAGMLAVEGILLALLQRSKSGKGQKVDISLLDGLLSLFAYQSQIALSTQSQPTRRGNEHPTIVPYETYRAGNGYFNLAVGSESLWRKFCTAIGRQDLLRDKRFRTNNLRVKNRRALNVTLQRLFARKGVADWKRLLEVNEIPVGLVNTVREAVKLRSIREREMILQTDHPTVGRLKMVGNPVKLSSLDRIQRRPPPTLGQHTRAILRWLGSSENVIRDFEHRGVV
jgi:crotonobetainyl-CoA:carnitine CoA-transferase CaiB-like acyl-CoA transferase